MNQAEILKAVSFPVELRQAGFQSASGWHNIPERKVVVRTDEREVPLSIVSDQYKLIPYRETTEPLLEAIEKNGGQLISRVNSVRRSDPLRVEGDGRRIWIEANFGGGIEIGKDLIQPRIVYGNSYDCTSAYRAIVGFYQVKCTNAGALMIPGKGFGMGSVQRRHSGGDDIPHDFVANHLREFLSGFGEMAESLKSMVNHVVPIDKAKEIYEKYVGSRVAEKKPLGPEEHESAWGFYARITNHLTMDYKGGQQPAERRAMLALGDVLKEMR